MGLNKDEVFERYDASLKRVNVMAFITNGLYSLNWFLGFCALTWASAVILGGLLTSLTQHDYYSVMVLLLLEAIRLAAATFFGYFVTRKLFYGSADPNLLVYDADDRRQKFLGVARILDQAVQLNVIAISILVPIRRLQDLAVLAPQSDLQGGFDGLKTSLLIFYVLVLVNGAIAAVAVLFSKTFILLFVTSFSLRKVYEKMVWKGMDEGLLHTTDVDLLAFAFQSQADEYRRNSRAIVVGRIFRDMIEYLYCHRYGKGFEAASVALESADIYEREAAANVVGLWAVLEKGSKSLRLQRKLLAKLAEALDHHETGRAATYSFERLSKEDPEGMRGVKSEGGEKLADILMDRINEVVDVEKHDKSLVFIKALIHLLPGLNRNGVYCNPENLDKLENNLKKIVRNESNLKRTQAVAGKALSLLSLQAPAVVAEIRGLLLAKPFRKRQYILSDEFQYAVRLFSSEHSKNTPELPEVPSLVFIKALIHLLSCMVKGGEEGLYYSQLDTLKNNLTAIACKVAGHVLISPLSPEDPALLAEIRSLLLSEPCRQRQNILPDEREYVVRLLGSDQDTKRTPSSWDSFVELRQIEETPEFPFLASSRTSYIAATLTILLMVVSSVFILRYAHF